MSIVGTVWTSRGPSPISTGSREDNGMVTAIAVHPGDSRIVYIGTAGGGIWKTGDGGVTWRPLFDREVSLGIGAPAGLALDPSDPDIIYAGTSGRRQVARQAQAGLFKSFDGGASWVLLGSGFPADNVGSATTFADEAINAIVVDPADSTVVYLASSTGVWRSVDAGLNWTRGTSSGGDARSLVLDPTSPTGARVLYAGVSGSGVIQSVDGGQTWSSVLTAATPAVAAALGAVAGTTMDHVMVDLAPPSSPPAAGGIQVLYVAIAGRNTAAPFLDPLGLFLSTDQGATWTQQAATGMTSASTTTFMGYCLALAVDPSSPGDGANDIVFLGTRDQARSTDAGASFTVLSGLHADTHAWGFSTPSGGSAPIVYCGTDGGIASSDDGGVTWVSRNAGRLQAGLLYNLDVRPDATASASAGAFQDNGLKLAGSGPTWSPGRGGDGWDIVYAGTDPSRLMASTNSGTAPQTRVLRSDDDGATWSDVTPFPNSGTEAQFFLTNLAADPSADDIFYAAGNVNVWQTQDSGGSWRAITPLASGFVTGTIAVAPTDGNAVAVASGSSVATQVLVSTDALGAAPTFTDITRNLPGRPVLRVAFDPNDATVVYAVLGGIAGFPGGHVFRTTLTSPSWTDISPALDVPFGALALDGDDTPTTLYVGTDLGVLRSVDRGATWTVLDDLRFPRASITDLVLGRGSSILRASTYGRGVFEFVRPDWPSIAINPQAGLDFGSTCDGPAYLEIDVFNVGASDLVITSVQRILGSTGFAALANPGTPVVVRPGEHISFTVSFTPTTPGVLEMGTIRIVSNDPAAPTVDLVATGTGGVPVLETAIADGGDFGAVCLGEFVDRDLVLNNHGRCTLLVEDISSSTTAFEVPGVASYPLAVAAGDSVAVPIRFRPTAGGPAAGMLQIDSTDTASPAFVDVSGTTPSGRLTITGTTDFGAVLLGSHVRQTLSICNTGDCDLRVTRVAFRPPCPCDERRRSPCGCGGCEGNDNHGTGTGYGGHGDHPDHDQQPYGAGYDDRKGHDRRCDQRCLNFRIVTNPFPATLHPGACLGVLLEYVPTCDSAACCELLIESDDPERERVTLLVTGHLRRTLRSALKCWAAQELHEILEAGNC